MPDLLPIALSRADVEALIDAILWVTGLEPAEMTEMEHQLLRIHGALCVAVETDRHEVAG